MNLPRTLPLLAIVVILAGCSGVSQEKYDAARAKIQEQRKSIEKLESGMADARERVDEMKAEVAEAEKRQQKLDERAAKLDKREQKIQQAEAKFEKNTIPGSGTFLVGEDIEPGTYYTDGPVGSSCYWARLSGTSGSFQDLITNGNISGPTTITIPASDAGFKTRACQDWHLR